MNSLPFSAPWQTPIVDTLLRHYRLPSLYLRSGYLFLKRYL